MRFTKYLILIVALYGMAEAQIIKSNVFTRADLDHTDNKASARALIGTSEWTTNSVPLYPGNHSSEASLNVDDALGDAGLRLKYGANDYVISAGSSGGVKLVSGTDGDPLLVSSPSAGTILNHTTLTNDVTTNPGDWRARLALNEAVTNTTPAGLELAATAGRTESEIVDRLVRIPRVKSAPVYVRRMRFDYPESTSVTNQHAAYQVIVPTPTSGEYAIYGFRQGVAQGCITLQSIGIGALVSTNVGTESGTWYDMDIYKPWSGRRTSSAGGYVEWTNLVGTSLAVAFLNSINVGYCGVSIDGDDTLANCLPAATEANYTNIGVDVGDRYWDGYATSANWKWALIATNLSNSAHTVRLTHLGKKNTSSSDTRIAVLYRGCGVVGAGTYSTSEFADVYTHCSSLGQFNQLSAFVGVMQLTNITCADSDFLGDYHAVHSDHLTQTNGTESITVDGVVRSMTAGDIVTGYDIKIVTTAQLMEEVGGMITNICARTVVWQFGARAGEEQCRVTLTHTWDIDTDIRIFYAAVLPHYQRWRPTYGYEYTYSKWVQNGTAYDIPTDDSWLGRYTPTATSAYLAGDKSYALTVLGGIGSPEIWEAVGGQTGAGIYHACQGRSSYVAKTYVSSVHNVAAFRATSGTTTTYNFGLSAGTVLDYSSLAYLLGL